MNIHGYFKNTKRHENQPQYSLLNTQYYFRMKTSVALLAIALLFSTCSQKQKKLADIKTGMTKNEVIASIGQPEKKNDIGVAELWVYPAVDRTVVFRQDTVYDIITSAEARADSIEATLKEAGRDIKQGLKKAGDKLDSVGGRIEGKLERDTF